MVWVVEFLVLVYRIVVAVKFCYVMSGSAHQGGGVCYSNFHIT